MSTPSKEEVAKAQEWLNAEGIRPTPGVVARLAELLASYAAERDSRSGTVSNLKSVSRLALELKEELGAEARARIEAESRLTSLREGLREIVQLCVYQPTDPKLRTEVRSGLLDEVENITRRLLTSSQPREAESLLAGLSPNETKGSTK